MTSYQNCPAVKRFKWIFLKRTLQSSAFFYLMFITCHCWGSVNDLAIYHTVPFQFAWLWLCWFLRDSGGREGDWSPTEAVMPAVPRRNSTSMAWLSWRRRSHSSLAENMMGSDSVLNNSTSTFTFHVGSLVRADKKTGRACTRGLISSKAIAEDGTQGNIWARDLCLATNVLGLFSYDHCPGEAWPEWPVEAARLSGGHEGTVWPQEAKPASYKAAKSSWACKMPWWWAAQRQRTYPVKETHLRLLCP